MGILIPLPDKDKNIEKFYQFYLTLSSLSKKNYRPSISSQGCQCTFYLYINRTIKKLLSVYQENKK